MVLYKDRFTGDILISDDYKMNLVDNLLYEVEGVMTEDGINIVIENKLISADIKKKTYQHYVKDYIGRIVESLKKEDPDSVEMFKKKAKKHLKQVTENFKEVDFFTGESASGEGMLIMCTFKDEDGPPTLTLWKHGIIEEDLRTYKDCIVFYGTPVQSVMMADTIAEANSY